MKEKLKTVLLWLLLISTLFLTLRTWVYDEALVADWGLERYPLLSALLGYTPAAPPERFAPVRWQYTAARLPALCSVSRNGERSGASLETTVSGVYKALCVTLGEALNTAGEPEVVSAGVWAEAMRADGFYFHYTDPVSLSLLAAWLTVNSGLEAEITGIGLSFTEEGCRLLFQDASGEFFKTSAELLWNGWPELPDLLPCAYAFETEELPEESPPWLLLTEDCPAVAALRVSPLPLFSQNMEAYVPFLRLLGIDSITTPSYPSEDARVYADGSRICRLRADGSIQYYNPEAPQTDSLLYVEDSERRTASRVERARALAASLEPLLGDASFVLLGVREQDGLSIVEFTAVSAGVPFDETPAYAVITVGDGLIRQADIRLTRVERAEEETPLLPLRYAMLLSPGTALTLHYRQTEDGVYEAAWGSEESSRG